MDVSDKLQAFILHFGEMGSRWGINRTVGQIYALLIVSNQPLNAEQICTALKFSRSNVSAGLKELHSWRLIKQQHLDGDRKDYFSAPDDLIDIARTLLEERRKREIDPTLDFLRATLAEPSVDDSEAYALERMQQIHDLIESVTEWADELQNMSAENLATLMRMSSGVSRLLSMKEKLFK